LSANHRAEEVSVHTHRSIVRRAFALGLALTIAAAAPAAASSLAAPQAQYYSSFRHEQPITAPAPQAAYYASFRNERPLKPLSSDSGSAGWLAPGLGLVAALLVAGAGVVGFRGVRAHQQARGAA
jgi:hypothetical protein